MSDNETSAKSTVNLDLTASTKAEFKAEIRAEVPTTSMGRLVDSLTDIIRPFSESRGLRADHLRLQREDVLIQIARKASERLRHEQISIQPVSNKILVPFLEKASLEDPTDEEMVSRWVNLLASAASGQSFPPRLVSTLSEMEAQDARLLETIYRTKQIKEGVKERLFALGAEVEPFNAVTKHFTSSVIYDGIQDKKIPGNAILDYLTVLLSGHGIYMIFAGYGKRQNYPLPKIIDESSIARSIEVLSALSLIQRDTAKGFLEKYHYDVQFYQITPLGVMLLSVCSQEAAREISAMRQPRTA
ncbi:hypothetical protein WHT83_04100 [Aminobacter sp. P9b]|uniref:Abi-alpha family protein n=1 Tax=Aminobacter sp. P9b TaxID=3133697 RepID=UPI00324AD9AD